jgi:asparagine synthase (glutamine-hydrolysing)
VRSALSGELAGVFDPSGHAGERQRLARALSDAGIGKPVDLGPLALGGPEIVELTGTVVAMAGAARTRSPTGAKATDLLTREFSRLGVNSLNQLEGAFAVAVWDRSTSTGLLAQDQLGGRSLFVCDLGGRLVFASEVRLVLDILGQSPGPDAVAMAHWLSDHRIHEGRTLYAGIVRIGGGRCYQLDAARAHGPIRWWSPRPEPLLDGEPAELACVLRESIGLQVAQAVGSAPTAVLLSGGLDSSLLAALAGNQARARCVALRTVSAVFPNEPEFDEWRWAQAVADAAGLSSERVEIRMREPLDLLALWLENWRLPLPSPGYLIERPLLGAAAAGGAQIALDGQGGDELFGVAGFLLGDLLRRGRLLSALRLASRYPEFGQRPSPRQVARLLRLQGVPAAMPYRLQEWRRLRRPSFAPAWLRPDLGRLHLETSDPWGWKLRTGALWWRSRADLLTNGREVADIADYVRRRAALAGLQAGSPFLSLPLVELALRLPPELNFDPRWTRSLVRESVRGLLPEDVRRRVGKTSFAPLYFRALTSTPSLARLRGLLEEDPEIAAFVDIAGVRRNLLAEPPGEAGRGWQQWMADAWHIAGAESWLRMLGGRRAQPERSDEPSPGR